MKQQPCPMCGLKVKLEQNRIPAHAGWDGEPCLAVGKTPMEAYDYLRSIPADPAI